MKKGIHRADLMSLVPISEAWLVCVKCMSKLCSQLATVQDIGLEYVLS